MNSIFEGLEFSDWLRWGDRNKAPWKNEYGIYLIAKFEGDGPPSGCADPVDEHVVYIGESLRNVTGRIRSFGRECSRSSKGVSANPSGPRSEYDVLLSDHYLAVTTTGPLEGAATDFSENSSLAEPSLPPKQLLSYRKFERQRLRKASSKTPLEQTWFKLVERWLLHQFVLEWGKLPTENNS